MSFSSSKSTSRKLNSSSTTTNSTRKDAPRRSQSVTSFSRTHFDVTSDFNNTRDNPLFWADASDFSDQFHSVSPNFNDFSGSKGCVNINGQDSRRGRSVTRNSTGGGGGAGGGGGRSLSMIHTARRRSPSRGRDFGNNNKYGRDESSLLSSVGSNKKIVFNRTQSILDDKTSKLVKSASDLSEVLKGSNTWSSQHPSERGQESALQSHSSSQNQAFETSHDSATSHYNDETPTRCISEIEERTIKPVSEERKVMHWEDDSDTTGGILETVRTEVRRAISDMHKDIKDAMLRSDSDVITNTMVSDVAPDLANLNTVELVSDFREEFTRELEECEERTRKLRAELAVEEHRELELNQILNDMIPEPETPQVQKSRLIRKGTLERRMSKCLEEEAMAYFDECVSISTFDDSDFSSLEDPPSQKSRAGETSYVPSVLNKNSVHWFLDSQDVICQGPSISLNEASHSSISGVSNTFSRNNPDILSRRHKFTFTSELLDSTAHEKGIRNCFKRFSKDKAQETVKSHILRVVPLKSERYESEIPVEKFLLDRMSFRSRIESGGILLCGGGINFPTSPFCSSNRFGTHTKKSLTLIARLIGNTRQMGYP